MQNQVEVLVHFPEKLPDEAPQLDVKGDLLVLEKQLRVKAVNKG